MTREIDRASTAPRPRPGAVRKPRLRPRLRAPAFRRGAVAVRIGEPR